MSLDKAILSAVGVEDEKDLDKAIESTDLSAPFLPTVYAEEFIELVREKNWCRQLFRTIGMPGTTFSIPKVTTDASVYYVAEGGSPTEDTALKTGLAGTVDLVAKKLMGYVDINAEVTEDAKVAMLPLVKNAFAEAMAIAEEKLIIQGTDEVGEIAAQGWIAGDPRRAFKGMLKLASAPIVDAGGNNIDIAIIENARRNLGKYGRAVDNLVLMVNPYSSSVLRQLDAVLTVDKYGPNRATNVRGEIGQLMGIRIVEDFWIPEGDVYDTSAAGEGRAILVRKDIPIIGDRRLVKFDQDKLVVSDQVRVVISERIGFNVQYTGAICVIDNLKTSIG